MSYQFVQDFVMWQMWDSLMHWVQTWYTNNATVGTLLFLMTCDVITGIMLAIVMRKLNSSTSTKGIMRKAVSILLVYVGAAMERFMGNAPVAEMIAIGFCISEILSITENAGKMGIPVPVPLQRVMSVLSDQAKDHSQRPDLVDQALNAFDHKDDTK